METVVLRQMIMNAGSSHGVRTVGSEEPFESLFGRFADGADARRLIAGAEISADTAAPDRQWQGPGTGSDRGSLYRPCGAAFCPGGTALGDRRGKPLFTGCHIVAHVECAVAGPELLKIRVPVVAWTDDIEILAFFTGSKPARAGAVTVPLFVLQKAPDEVLGKIGIGI
jgi:hypothetical protein